MSRTGSASLDNALGLSDSPTTTGSDSLDSALGLGKYMVSYTPPAPIAQPSAPIPSGTPPENILSVKNYFVDKGLPDHVASAIAGNIAQESGGNPDAVNPKSGAFGIAQFLGDRKTGLFDYAKKNHVFPNDLSTQLDYMMQELQGRDKGANQALNLMLDTDNVADAATIFANKYERMGKAEANMPKRIAVAEQLAQQPAQQQQAPQPQQPPAPPVPQASPINPEAAPGLAPVATPEGPKAPTPDIETLKGMRYNFVAGLQHLGANVAEG